MFRRQNVHVVLYWSWLCCCFCDRVAVASPETLSLMEVFLGIASVYLALAVWRFYNKSLGRLCHAKHASAWGSSHRVPCCRACLCMQEWLPWDCCELSRWKRAKAPLWDIHHCFVQDGFCRPTLGWAKHELQSFSALSHLCSPYLISVSFPPSSSSPPQFDHVLDGSTFSITGSIGQVTPSLVS
jgi:hypothetical protein